MSAFPQLLARTDWTQEKGFEMVPAGARGKGWIGQEPKHDAGGCGNRSGGNGFRGFNDGMRRTGGLFLSLPFYNKTRNVEVSCGVLVANCQH